MALRLSGEIGSPPMSQIAEQVSRRIEAGSMESATYCSASQISPVLSVRSTPGATVTVPRIAPQRSKASLTSPPRGTTAAMGRLCLSRTMRSVFPCATSSISPRHCALKAVTPMADSFVETAGMIASDMDHYKWTRNKKQEARNPPTCTRHRASTITRKQCTLFSYEEHHLERRRGSD